MPGLASANRDYDYFYKAQGPVADAYLRDRSQRSFIMGPLGSAKTNTSCWKAFRVMTDQLPGADGVRRTRVAAVRNTYGELLSTTAKDWLEMFGGLGQMVYGSKEPPCHYLRFRLPPSRPGAKPTIVEAEMVFAALDREDHVRKIRGMQLTAVMLSEAKELPFGIVSMLDLRTGRYPRMDGVEPTWHGMFGDTNAPDTDHWFYRMAEELRPKGWAFHKQPGGLTRITPDSPWTLNHDAENLRNLPGAYGDYYLKGMQGKDDTWIAVNLGNQYGFVRDGKPVYPDYNDQAHCKLFELTKELGIYVGIDFGLTPAATIGQRSMSGQWRIRHELVTEDTGIHKFAHELNAFMREHYTGWPINGIYGDPAGGQRQAGDVDERTAFQILKANDIDAEPCPFPGQDNDIVLRTESFAAPMRRFADGQPGMLIHPDCKVLRKGCQGGYAYKRVKVVGEERYRDLPDKNKYSHPADAGQYMLLGAGEGVQVLESTTTNAKMGYEGFRKRMGYS